MGFFLTLRFFLISIGIFFTAFGVHLSVPLITEFLVTHVSLSITCNFFLRCFKPPYIFLLFNAIIIFIFASSKLHRSHITPLPPPPLPTYLENPIPLQEEDPPVVVKRVVVAAIKENGTTMPTEIPGETTPLAPSMDEVWKMITERGGATALEKPEKVKAKVKVRDEPSRSPSLVELNRRVEAFIKKFNEEMRSQEQRMAH